MLKLVNVTKEFRIKKRVQFLTIKGYLAYISSYTILILFRVYQYGSSPNNWDDHVTVWSIYLIITRYLKCSRNYMKFLSFRERWGCACIILMHLGLPYSLQSDTDISCELSQLWNFMIEWALGLNRPSKNNHDIKQDSTNHQYKLAK